MGIGASIKTVYLIMLFMQLELEGIDRIVINRHSRIPYRTIDYQEEVVFYESGRGPREFHFARILGPGL